MLYNSCYNKNIYFFKYLYFIIIFKLGLVWFFYFKFWDWMNVIKYENKSGCIIFEFVYIFVLNIKRGVFKILRIIVVLVGYFFGKLFFFF